MPIQNQEIILNALQQVQSRVGGTAAFSVTKVIKELKAIIIEEFDTTKTLERYKDLWSNRINTVAAENDFVLLKRRPSWTSIESDLLNKTNNASNKTNIPVSGIPPSSTRSRISSSANSTVSYVLTPDDKQYINNLYENLNQSNMWTLSTGTIVEKRMEELAKKCVVEHPCHSLILDLEDKTWNDYFTQAELDEIRDHRYKNMIAPPPEFKEYLEGLLQNDDIKKMHRDLLSNYYDPDTSPSCYWAQTILINGLDLIRSGFFNKLSDCSERDFVTRIWKMMLTVHDYSKLSVNEEIFSNACSIEMNKSRRLGSTTPLAKKKHSKKLDHLYSFEDKELGFLEAAKKSDENGNKEYKDACIKSPKAMKDFLLQLTKDSPDLIRSIRVPCLITSARDVKMLLLDSPEGYICRVTRSETYHYPSSYTTFLSDIIPCLELGWQMKSIMEETLSTLITSTRCTFRIKRKRSFEMPSSFVRGNKKTVSNSATLSNSSGSDS
ncbi:hypothetical protein CLU79DRAFT_891055 [Phycomyces nitens]|nr:hypothetical protein CLU79DRAFT_891055 [Phycomyces nitens]